MLGGLDQSLRGVPWVPKFAMLRDASNAICSGRYGAVNFGGVSDLIGGLGLPENVHESICVVDYIRGEELEEP